MEAQTATPSKIRSTGFPEVILRIDEPAGNILKEGECSFCGWASSNRAAVLDRIVFRTSAGIVKCRSVDRPDAKSANPGMSVLGFTGTLSLVDHITAVKDNQLRVLMYSGTSIVARCQFYVAPGVVRRTIQRALGC